MHTKRWKVGTFKPIREYEGGAVSQLQENLRYRVIPAIKDGNKDILKKAEGFVYSLMAYAETLRLEDIKRLNENMSAPDGLPLVKPVKVGYLPRLSAFLRSHTMVQHVAAGGLIATACVITGYALVYWGLPKEAAITDALIIFGILVGAYVTVFWSTRR